jgi:hypothetical protein
MAGEKWQVTVSAPPLIFMNVGHLQAVIYAGIALSAPCSLLLPAECRTQRSTIGFCSKGIGDSSCLAQVLTTAYQSNREAHSEEGDLSMNSVISGGQLKRMGSKLVPIPRLVYRTSRPTRRRPRGYLRPSGGK